MKPCRLNTHKGCRIFLSFELPGNNKKKSMTKLLISIKNSKSPLLSLLFYLSFYFIFFHAGGVDDAANMCIIIGQYSPPFFIILFQLKTFPLFELHA